jgi:hypothetical protein
MLVFLEPRGEKTCFKDKERPGTQAEGLNLLKSKGKYIIRIKEECRQKSNLKLKPLKIYNTIIHLHINLFKKNIFF